MELPYPACDPEAAGRRLGAMPLLFLGLDNANLETSKAWRLKESFSGFWDYIFSAQLPV